MDKDYQIAERFTRLSKLEAGKATLEINEHDITNIVLSSVDEVSSLISDKNITVIFSRDETLFATLIHK